MKVVAISDTHNKFDVTKIPIGDVLIHAGDATVNGTAEELNYFFSLFCSLPHKYKIFVPGNHDSLIERDPDNARDLFNMHRRENDYLLVNRSVVLGGVRFFGFPYIPYIRGQWSFERKNDGLSYLTENIPRDINVLISHSPARGLVDQFKPGINYGNTSMRETFFSERPLLKHMICGHIHEAYGKESKYGVDFYNAAYLSGISDQYNTPWEFEV